MTRHLRTLAATLLFVAALATVTMASNITLSSGKKPAPTSTVVLATFSPVAGTYTAAQNVTITSTTAGASIRYTTNGTTPTDTTGTLYSSPVTISATTTLKAVAYKAGSITSAVSSALYTINIPVANVIAPVFSPGAGTYAAGQNVTITSATSGATIRYTTDNTTPTSTVGTIYSTAVAISTTTTLKAIAYKSGSTNSSVTTAIYTITAASSEPRGVYNLLSEGNRPPSYALTNPNVDGISIRMDWGNLRPKAPGDNSTGHTDGYNNATLAQLDADISNSTSSPALKDVYLRIGTGGGPKQAWVDSNGVTHTADAGGRKPGWLFKEVEASNAITPTNDDKIIAVSDNDCPTASPCKDIIVWWSPIYKTRYREVLSFIGNRYQGNARVKILSTAIGNTSTNDWSLPDGTVAERKVLTDAGYTDTKFINAMCPAGVNDKTGFIDAAIASKPGSYVSFAVGPINTALSSCGSGNCVINQIIDNARAKYPNRIIPQLSQLSERTGQTTNPNSVGPPTEANYYVGRREQILFDRKPLIGWQMVWKSTGDAVECRNSLYFPGGLPPGGCNASATMVHSINRAKEYNARYVEIYSVDVRDLPAAVIACAHNVLRNDKIYNPADPDTFCSESSALVAAPRGVFDLLSEGSAPAQAALNNPDVDGVAVRVKWSSLQPNTPAANTSDSAATNFNWTALDTAVNNSTLANKEVIIRVQTGGDNAQAWTDSTYTGAVSCPPQAGVAVPTGCHVASQSSGNKPGWLFKEIKASNVASPTNEDKIVSVTEGDGSKDMPVFWSPILISRTRAMLTAVGNKYSGNSLVKVINVATANYHGNDWTGGAINTDLSVWQNAGMTKQKMVDSVCPALGTGGTLDAAMAALPGRYVNLATGPIHPSLSCVGNQFCVSQEIIANANAKYPGRFIVNNNALSQQVPAAPGTDRWVLLYNNRPLNAFQMLWFSYGDAACQNAPLPTPATCDPAITLGSSIDTAVGYESRFVEIYQTDIINQPSVIATAHTKLTQ